MTLRALRGPVALIAGALVAMSVAAAFAGVPITRITQIAIYVLYGAGVNLLIAYTGLVPFGASVFFGCGSYAAALAAIHVSGNEVAALAIATLYSLVSAALLGLLVLRRRGLYFSLLTLAASQIAFEVVFRWTELTGGENGLQDLPRPLLPGAVSFHVFTLVVVALLLGLMWRIVHAPIGRALQGIRDNETRMASLGYDTGRLKLVAFTLTGGFVGVAGALLALLLQGAYPNNLSWQHAGDALLMVVLGGVHHALGPLFGATLFILLEDRLSALFENWWLAFAPILIVFALAAPEGMAGLVRRAFGRRGWSLVRPDIPPRPAAIRPFAAGRAPLDPASPLLSVRGLGKHFGSLHVARDIDLDVMPYRLHSLIGPNGAGKTTFFNMLTGILAPDGGTIVFLGRDVTRMPMFRRVRLGLARSFQIVSVFPNLSAFENVRIAVQGRAKGLWRDAYRDDGVNDRTWSVLAAVGLADRAGETAENLSHGERRLLEIAVTIATDAKLLLLDEPLAGLSETDRTVVSRLIRELAETHAVLLVEHDLDRVVSLSDRISVLHGGRLIADGTPADVVRDPAVVTAYLGHAHEARTGTRAPAVVAGPVAAPTGEPLLRVRGLVAGYGGSRVLDRIDLDVRPGETIALLGRNGVGKTTLLRALTGTIPISDGTITFDGQSLVGQPTHAINRAGIALVPEGRRLFPNLTVRDNLRLAARPGGASFDEIHALFPRLLERADVLAENLSGGERQMGAIARVLMMPGRLVLLDEPFEGLAPAIIADITDAIRQLKRRRAIVLVEHHAEQVLSLADRAVVLVNGRIAFDGPSAELAADHALQARLLGIVGAEDEAA